jgi:hypothetical protein
MLTMDCYCEELGEEKEDEERKEWLEYEIGKIVELLNSLDRHLHVSYNEDMR